MATSNVVTLPIAERQILAVPLPFRRQLVHALLRLKNDPRPANSHVLELDVHRLVLHGWRVVYVVEDEQLVITIVRVAQDSPGP